MRQYFYLVAHMVIGDDLYIDKIFLQEHDAIRWGKVLATKKSRLFRRFVQTRDCKDSNGEVCKDLNRLQVIWVG